MYKSKVAKNNNLALFRDKQREKNEALVLRAIEHIRSLGGELTFSAVSKVTYDIAKSDEKGLTLAAISKSKVYRPMIEKAQDSYSVSSFSSPLKPTKSRTLSVGDMKLELHTLRVQNQKLKDANKTLVLKMKETAIPLQEIGAIETSIIKRSDEIGGIAKSIVNRLLEVELAYIDTQNRTLNMATFDDVLIPSEALKLFFEKELHEIISNLR